MKKFFSFMLAFVMVLSMSVTAFAADGQGSITITNATIGQSYSVYKLFDATYDGTNAVAYSIDPGDPEDNYASRNQFFTVLFGEDGTTSNPYFSYDATSGAVSKKDGVNDTNIFTYVTSLIKTDSTPEVEPITASETTGTEITFENLPYGYYVIKSTLGATVTINSNTPDVQVIDKNQQGATKFLKQVKTTDAQGDEGWGSSNSACFGESVEYKMSFTATNYGGENPIQFYSVYDTTGVAIEPDFTSISIKVGDQTLTKGYLIGTGDYKELGQIMGSWEGNPTNEAEYYVVRSSANEFRISIPWKEGHTLHGSGTGGYSLAFEDDAEFKFESPVAVEITYNATLLENATIGGASYNAGTSNNINTAYVRWTYPGTTGAASTIHSTVHTYAYGVGILKEDTATKANLAGAEFAVYKDETCTDPVNFVTTDIQGVYNHDDDGEGASNVVVTPVNGKAVLLGLKNGTYYVQETKAPDGYNAVSHPIAITIGENKSEEFVVYAYNEAANRDDSEDTFNGLVIDTVQDPEGVDGLYTRHSYGVTKQVVGNSKGIELPSTGGTGTTMLITFGSLIAIAFAVFLITHKKMSVYED